MKLMPFSLAVAVLSLCADAARAANPPAASSAPAAAWTLAQVYDKALQNSERIAVSQEAVRQAEALYKETLGTAGPELFFRHQSIWQDRTGVGGNTSATITQSPQNEGSFRLRRENFTGYRELAALRSGGSLVEQREWEKARVEQLLLQDVAAAFYGALEAEESLGSTRKLIDLTEDRLAEQRRRVRLGRSRETEALGTDYQIATLRAQEDLAARDVDAHRDLLGFLTGVPVGALRAGDGAVEAAGLDAYLARTPNRPDVRAAAEAAGVARAAVRVARADHLPSADVNAGVYAYRPNAREEINWDATLGVELPIFSWNAVNGRVKAARAEQRQAELELRAAQRQADLDIRNAHRDLLSARRRLEIRERAVSVARRDYELQARDDKRGLVTPLDVLESLDRLNAAELALNNARLDARLAALNLEIAAGAAPGDVLK